MTLTEFETLTRVALRLAGPDLSEPARCLIVDRCLREYAVRMPTEVEAYREAVAQQAEITEAVKMAAAAGTLHHHAVRGEPS